MLKCASVYTYEMDHHEAALGEIKAQLEEKITLLESTVGVVMCNPEFISSGAMRYICENLPFDLVGVTTASQAVNGEAGELILTIFVMTSDDVVFKTGVTESLLGDIYAPTKAAFDKASSGVFGQPKLAIVFPPIISGHAGDNYIRAWGEITPNTPVFGTLAVDDTVTFSFSETIYNGVNYAASMSFVLCYGNINPRFLIASLPESDVTSYTGEVTKSTGALVHEINHMNAYEYFDSLEIVRDLSAMQNLLLLPIMLDLIKREDYDGIPVVRGHTSFMPDGTAVFSGDVDEGSTFALIPCNSDNVMETTLQNIERINALPDVNGVLLFSCIARRMVLLGIDPLLELESVRDKINAEIPFMIGYAGGEICPTSVRSGVPTNRFHNYTLVVLAV